MTRRGIREIEKAFAAENVVIAEVGAWVNMLDPDAEKRAKNLRYVIERLALAEAVGARCCPDIAGSYNPTVWYGPHPKNLSQEFFDATVENCRHVIDAVKPRRTKFTIEMMGWNIPDGPDSYLRADPRRRPPGLRRPYGRVQRHQQPDEVSTAAANSSRSASASWARGSPPATPKICSGLPS